MYHLSLLLKVSFQNMLGGLRNRKTPYIASCILLGFAYIMLGVFCVGQGVAISVMAISNHTPEYGIFICILVSVVIGLFFGILRASQQNKNNDADLLLAMPIKKSTVVISSFVIRYFYDGPMIILIMLSSVLSNFVLGQLDVLGLLRGILITFLLPLLSIVFSTTIGTFLLFIKTRFKGGSYIITALSLALMMAYFYFASSSSSIMTALVKSTKNSTEFMNKVKPIYWIADAIFSGNPLFMAFTLAVLLIPFVLLVIYVAKNITKTDYQHSSKDKRIRIKTITPTRAFFGMEVRKYLSSSIYVMNTLFGPVLLILLMVTTLVLGPEQMISFFGKSFSASSADGDVVIRQASSAVISAFLCSIMTFISTMVLTTPASVSLEGSRLWITKTMPVSTRQILWSKIGLNIVLCVPALLVCGTTIGIRMQLPALMILFDVLIAVIASICSSVWGMIMGLLFVRLDWTNEAQVVKQGMAMGISMLIGGFIDAFVITILLVTAVMKLSDSAIYIALSVCLGFVLLLAGIGIVIVENYGVRRFNSLRG